METKQPAIILDRGKLYIPDTCSVRTAANLVRRYSTYDVEIVKMNNLSGGSRNNEI